jgi:hypothetical protein
MQNIFQPPQNRGTAVFYAFDYLIGLGVFGFVYVLLNMILPAFEVLSSTGQVHDLANFLWTAVIIVYLVFGPFYFWNRLKEYNS